MKIAPLCALAGLGALLAACHPDCPLCYQDQWSRTPFPDEQTQHIKPLTPEELQANGALVLPVSDTATGVTPTAGATHAANP